MRKPTDIMRFRSLESRIVTLFLVLLIVVQLVGLIVIQRGIDSNARAAIASELVNGSKVFARLMDQNAQNLRNGARLLSRDAGFLSAIGNTDDDDRATIESALANHGRRIKAAMTMLVSPERKVVASTSDAQAAGLAHMVMAMLDKAEQDDGATGIAIVERLPYQVVVVPVKAPVTIGFVVMTFPLDERLARDMQETTALQTLLLTRDMNGRWLPVASSLAQPVVERILLQLQGMGSMPAEAFDVDIVDDKLSVHMTKIGEDDGNVAVAMLGRSIDGKLQGLISLSGQSEARTLLFAALLLADELHELGSGGALPPAAPGNGQIAEALEGLAARLVDLAGRLERAG